VKPESEEIVELERADGASRDGIGEEDHAIPFWFNATFGATIVFAVVYVFYYVGSDWTQKRQYEAELARVAATAEQVRAARPSENPFRGDAEAIRAGAEVFTTICAVCHKPDASGLVGPSLVDPYWKYGHADAELFESVSAGRPLGMPPWGPQLGDEKIWKVLAYLETLPKSSAPGVGSPEYVAPAPAATAAPAPAGGG
jgi:cytochrome c oxidase cbb3-type subunit 3